jgi:Zn-dependent peptidase ImmA (M78 family)
MKGAPFAKKLRTDLGLASPPFLPSEACMRLDYEYQQSNLDGCLGMALSVSGEKAIMVSNKIRERGRINFTAAHELGHLTIPSHADQPSYRCTKKSFNLWNGKGADQKEVEANEFAGEWLMPEDLFRRTLANKEPGFDTISALATEFDVSLTAAAIRLVDLSDEQILLVASDEKGVMKFFRSGKEFPFKLDWGVVPDTYVRGAKTGKPLPTEFMVVNSDDWLTGNQPESGEILEYSVKLGNYGTVLTMLWVEE